MRTVTEFIISTSLTDQRVDLVSRSLTEYGWVSPEIGATGKNIIELAQTVVAGTRDSHDLPVSPDSQVIQAAIDEKYPPAPEGTASRSRSHKASSGFPLFSFERHCLEQSILILTQVPADERSETFSRDLKVIVSPEFGVYGLMSFRPGQDQFITRLRCNDLDRLQRAAVSFAAAMNPSRRPGAAKRLTSRAASISRGTRGAQPFESSFNRLELRSVANELLFRGEVIPIRGRFALVRNSFGNRSSRLLAGLSLFLIAASALLFALAPATGWSGWSEQLVGRLATGAFGALLIDGAIDYSALRRSLLAGGVGPVTHGALINWKRA